MTDCSFLFSNDDDGGVIWTFFKGLTHEKNKKGNKMYLKRIAHQGVVLEGRFIMSSFFDFMDQFIPELREIEMNDFVGSVFLEISAEKSSAIIRVDQDQAEFFDCDFDPNEFLANFISRFYQREPLKITGDDFVAPSLYPLIEFMDHRHIVLLLNQNMDTLDKFDPNNDDVYNTLLLRMVINRDQKALNIFNDQLSKSLKMGPHIMKTQLILVKRYLQSLGMNWMNIDIPFSDQQKELFSQYDVPD